MNRGKAVPAECYHLYALPPIVRTSRLILRPYREEDIDPLFEIWKNPEVRRYLWDDIVIDRGLARDVVMLSLDDWREFGIGQWVMEHPPAPDAIGFCGFRRFGDMVAWELLYGLLPEYWGRGLAVEACRAVLPIAFAVLRCERIASRTDPPNAASIRVMEKLDLEREGITRENGLDILTYWARPARFPAAV